MRKYILEIDFDDCDESKFDVTDWLDQGAPSAFPVGSDESGEDDVIFIGSYTVEEIKEDKTND